MTANETIKQQVEHQMRIIKQGAENLVGEEELEAKLKNSILTGKPLTVKFGMDPSAPDIHIGHAVVLRKLKQLQDMGHTIVIIIGDFTAKIGDPTGKSKGRKAMTEQEVLVNAQTYQEQIFRILDREKTQVRYNGEWLEQLQLDEVLKLASTITVARMLERDDFENRFHNNIPIGLHEFFYPLMQAYDSVVLEADLELGGTDQTFNILMGRSLQKNRGMEPQAALFMPILEGIDGVEKMSKSLGNYIGIYEDAKTMFHKVMQIPDCIIIKYFELTTDILPEELDEIKAALEAGQNPKESKLLLARTVTSLYHTPEETVAGERFFEEAFTKKETPQEVESLEIAVGQRNLFDCLTPFVESGLVNSGSELRRLVAQGGVRKNGVPVTGMEDSIEDGDVLRIGRKKFVKLMLI
ncbi:MAG: tyrosine--tRNA ligase [Lachnospiraceae bacterium]|nr:tyrosine--tRNA ligase [Lachnospiraceae bacterium]